MADVSVLLTLYMILTRKCHEQDLPCALQGSLSPKNNQSPTTRMKEQGKTGKGPPPPKKRDLEWILIDFPLRLFSHFFGLHNGVCMVIALLPGVDAFPPEYLAWVLENG